MESLKIPGKVFLMGEYSAIEGGKALIAAVSPFYEYSTTEGESVKVHAEGPLGKYLQQSHQKLDLKMVNPGLGSGFGTSTAELIAGMYLINGVLPEGNATLNWYRKSFSEASGADLSVQLAAARQSHALFEVSNHQVRLVPESDLLSKILMFQVPIEEKVATHANLKKTRSVVPVEDANRFVDLFKLALRTNELAGLQVLTEWANWLSGLGLETEFAQKVRSRFLRISGVIGAKGCGAGLNDVFLVAIDERKNVQVDLMVAAEELKLKFLGNLKERLC